MTFAEERRIMLATIMAKKKSKPVEPKAADADAEPTWDVFARIDPSLRQPVMDYINAQKFPPKLARVIEHALRVMLKHESGKPSE